MSYRAYNLWTADVVERVMLTLYFDEVEPRRRVVGGFHKIVMWDREYESLRATPQSYFPGSRP